MRGMQLLREIEFLFIFQLCQANKFERKALRKKTSKYGIGVIFLILSIYSQILSELYS